MTVALASAMGAGVLARAARRWPARERVRRHRPMRRPTMPAPVRRFLVQQLFAADLDLSPEDALAVTGTAILVGGLLAGAVNLLLAPVAMLVILVLVPVGLVMARGRARRAYVEALPGFVDLVATQLRSGHTVDSALDDLSDRPGRVAPDLRRLRQRVGLGAPLETALIAWAAERPWAPVRAVAGAFALANETGGAAADALDGLARSMRDLLGAEAEAHALSAQARLSAVVVGAAPLAYLVFAAAADPKSATALVNTGVGRVCLVVGLGLEAAGAWWMHRIVTSAP